MKLSAECPSAILVGKPLTFDDGERVQWSVTEHEGMCVPGARGDRCLIFISESVCRRVRAVPAGLAHAVGNRADTLSWQR